MFYELEDIKRRHNLYWDIYNVEGWVTPPDHSHTWNYQRGLMAGLTASLFQETWTAFQESWRLLAKRYEQPANFGQVGTYVKTILRMDNYKSALKTRWQYATALSLFDLAPRLALMRFVNGGWQRPFGGFEYNFSRKVPGMLAMSAVTAPLSVPFEMARMTYYADKTFPKELQRGYTSYFNALYRIPFEEGPYWLFKNSFPLYFRNFLGYYTLFFTFDWLKDKTSFMWRVGEVPYAPCKVGLIGFASTLACIFTYPFAVTARQMVDFWPKEKGGVCTFNNNYRQAAIWLWYHEFSSNYFPGLFNNYYWRTMPQMFVMMYLADSFGMFTPQVIDLMSGQGNNSWEDSFA